MEVPRGCQKQHGFMTKEGRSNRINCMIELIRNEVFFTIFILESYTHCSSFSLFQWETMQEWDFLQGSFLRSSFEKKLKVFHFRSQTWHTGQLHFIKENWNQNIIEHDEWLFFLFSTRRVLRNIFYQSDKLLFNYIVKLLHWLIYSFKHDDIRGDIIYPIVLCLCQLATQASHTQ